MKRFSKFLAGHSWRLASRSELLLRIILAFCYSCQNPKRDTCSIHYSADVTTHHLSELAESLGDTYRDVYLKN